MWWSEQRKPFVIHVIVLLLLELIGSHPNFLSGGTSAVAAVPIFPVVSLADRVLSVRVKRNQESNLASSSVGDGTKGSAVSSTTLHSNDGGGGGVSEKLNVSKPTVGPSTSPVSKVKEQTMFIPDRSPPDLSPAQNKEENFSEEEGDSDSPSKRPGQGDFDEKAVQRTIIVIAGIAVIVVAYLGIKFVLIKRRKIVKRYGRVEASEMDLLDEVEEEEDSDEEEELFDINQQRRS